MRVRVRVLSGSQKGAVVEMERTEAEVNLATGFGELVSSEEEPEKAPDPVVQPKAKKKVPQEVEG